MEATTLGMQEIAAFARSVSGGTGDAVTLLAGQASGRRYHRVLTGGKPASVIVMELPPEDRSVPEALYPFLNVHALLSAAGFPVPDVIAARLSAGVIALEDLGDQTLELALQAGGSTDAVVRSLFGKVIPLIGRLQDVGRAVDSRCLAFGRRFDFKLLRWELDHFREWLLEEHHQAHLSPSEQSVVARSFDRIAEELAESPAVLVHRDFQSRNLMVVPNGPPVRVIDFQDALMGPVVYDLVALLRDSYVELTDAQVTDFINEFSIDRGLDANFVRRLFQLQTVQRKLKDAGRFVFIDKKRGNPSFLPCIPLSLKYVRDALGALPELEDLLAVLSAHVPELRSR